MTRTELLALADALEKCNPCRNSASVYQAADFMRQLAESKPVGTVAQHNYETFQSWLYGDGKVIPWTLKRPHAAPMLFRELEVGTALYTLPLED